MSPCRLLSARSSAGDDRTTPETDPDRGGSTRQTRWLSEARWSEGCRRYPTRGRQLRWWMDLIIAPKTRSGAARYRSIAELWKARGLLRTVSVPAANLFDILPRQFFHFPIQG